MSETSFLKKLKAAVVGNNSLLCVGLDPVPDRLPDAVMGKDDPVLYFNKKLIDATADLVCAYKPNFAFYGALGEIGWSTLKATVEHIPSHIPVLVDAKVGDIGSTAERYAHMFFGELAADALTVNPYMGGDAVAPFLEYSGGAVEAAERCVFLVCLTSNPGSREIQLWEASGVAVYRKVISMVRDLNENNNCGLVIGATKSEQMADIRLEAGRIPFLVPGIGAQGGDLEASVSACTGDGIGLINVSRAVLYTSDPAHAALDYNSRINSIIKNASSF